MAWGDPSLGVDERARQIDGRRANGKTRRRPFPQSRARGHTGTAMQPILANLLGIVAILAIAFVLSVGKRRVRPRVVAAAFALQALMAFLVLGTTGGRFVIQ